MDRYITSAFIATSLRPAEKEINDWFADILRSLSIDPHFGDEPETEGIPSKIKKMIGEHPNFIAILTKRDQIEDDKWRPPEWVNNEIGIAHAYDRKIAVFVEEGVETRGITPNITGYVNFNRDKLMETTPEIIALLISLFKSQFKDASFHTFLSLQSQYAVLSSIQLYYKKIKTLKDIEREVEEGSIKIHSIFKKGAGISVLMKGGENSSIINGAIFDILQIIKIGDQDSFHEKVASIRVIDVQKRISKCQFLEFIEPGFWGFLETNVEGTLSMPAHALKVEMPAGSPSMSSKAIEEFLQFISDMLHGCNTEWEKFQGRLMYGY